MPSVGWAAVASAVEAYGTPLYVLDGPAIAASAERWAAAAAGLGGTAHYSVKANPAPPILEAARDAGLGLDLTSAFDAAAADHVGVPPELLTFCTKVPDRADIEAGLRCGSVVAGTEAQLGQWRRAGRSRLGIRVNLGISAGFHRDVQTAAAVDDGRFGAPLAHVEAVVGAARRRGAEIVGLHTHLGSDILDVAPHVEAAGRLLSLAGRLGGIEWINIGGGYGVPFADEPEYPVDALVTGIEQAWRAGADAPRVRFEPGTHIVRAAGWLVTTVQTVRRTGEVQLVECDTSVNHLAGALLYGTQHPVEVVAHQSDGDPIPTFVSGNLMQPGDVLARRAPLPPLEPGAALAFGLAGAYTSVRASTFNGRPLPAEVWIDAQGTRLTRRRRTPGELFDEELG